MYFIFKSIQKAKNNKNIKWVKDSRDVKLTIYNNFNLDVFFFF